MKKKFFLGISVFLIIFAAYSQESGNGFEYRVKAGISLGGTAPLPLPAEIRKVKSYAPLLNMSVGGEVLKHLDENWSVMTGLRFETKGMETHASVKSYNLTMVSGDDGELSGVFTGMVRTKVKNSYLTLPILAMWQPNATAKWGVKAGLYGSFLLEGDFGGSAYDGYLREGDPTGDKIEITTASYEFSGDLQRWNLGVQFGAEWRPFPHLLAGLDLTWGVNSIFKKDFDVIVYKMYPVYGTLNFGYVFF
ncbi:membrane protein [Bacteroidia bacterium]|nr:membrane protein [Bacteroidia bacterium]